MTTNFDSSEAYWTYDLQLNHTVNNLNIFHKYSQKEYILL